MEVHLPKELDAQKAIAEIYKATIKSISLKNSLKFSLQAHEEQEEYGDVVYLLAGPLEYLVDPCLGHGELEGGADEADHDEGPGI